MRLIPADEQITVGGDDSPLQTPARLRFTVFPWDASHPQIHLKGLNCFLVKDGNHQRLSGAADVAGDTELQLVSPARDALDTVRIMFGEDNVDAESRTFALDGVPPSLEIRP